MNSVVNPINKLKNNGTNINANGIKNLKFSSNVNEIDIQYIFVKKYPNPNNQP